MSEKNSATAVKKLQSTLKKIGQADPRELPSGDDPVAVLVLSFLLWESTTDKAVTAYERIVDRVVDFNDLRVSMPHEFVDIIGERYPRALDRAQRLRAVLRDIYNREHMVSLSHLKEVGKRDTKKYVESLEGIVPYVSSRVLLVCFGTHSIPVDEQLRSMLADSDVAGADDDVAELSSWLTRQVKAEEGLATHLALQAWVDSTPATSRTQKKSTRKTSRSKTTTRKKTTTKKSSKKTAGKA